MENIQTTIKLPYEAPAIEVIELLEAPKMLASSPKQYSGSGEDDWFDAN